MGKFNVWTVHCHKKRWPLWRGGGSIDCIPGALPLSYGRQVELTPLRLENVGLGDGLDSYGRLKTDKYDKV